MGQQGIKQAKAIELLASKPVMSIQVLSETANIMRRKLSYDGASISAVIDRLSQTCSSLQPLTLSTLTAALGISGRYGFSHYDSLIVAAALQGNCTTLFSEDLQHGQTIDERLVIVNPFL